MQTARADERQRQQTLARERMEEAGEQDQAAMMEIAMVMMQPISRDGLDALDEAFFEGVATLTETPERLEPWRLARVRELATGGGGMMSAGLEAVGVPDDRWKVDLLMVVEESDLDDQDRENAKAAMVDWHAAATKALLDIRAAEDELEAGMQAMMKAATDTGKVEIDIEAAMKVDKLHAKNQNARLDLSLLNQAAVDAIANAVLDGQTLRRTWLEAAFPHVASDDGFVRLYKRAAAAGELTDDQRAAIALLRAEHDEAWWAATEDATAIIAAEREPITNQQEAFFAGQQIRQEVDRQTFSRREAALKRIEQLRAILNQQQLAAAEGLADPPEHQGLAMPF